MEVLLHALIHPVTHVMRLPLPNLENPGRRTKRKSIAHWWTNNPRGPIPLPDFREHHARAIFQPTRIFCFIRKNQDGNKFTAFFTLYMLAVKSLPFRWWSVIRKGSGFPNVSRSAQGKIHLSHNFH